MTIVDLNEPDKNSSLITRIIISENNQNFYTCTMLNRAKDWPQNKDSPMAHFMDAEGEVHNENAQLRMRHTLGIMDENHAHKIIQALTTALLLGWFKQ